MLVDESDRPIGTAEKIEAHRNGGRLHRAFSIFLFDGDGRLLLQQRAAGKYHFPLLWTNSCCGHPRPGEDVRGAAERRTREELGVDVSLRHAFAFIYAAEDAASGLTEHEYDHVLLGRLEGPLRPDPDEVGAVAWWDPRELIRDVAERPATYTPWFRQALEHIAARGMLEAAGSSPESAAGRATTS